MTTYETAPTPVGSSDADRMGELLDRADITDVIGRYCFGMDSRDWEMYRGAWTDEMKTDLIELSGSQVGRTTISTDDWVEALKAFFSEMEFSQHLKTPVAFEFDETRDNATVLSVMQGKHWASTRTGEHISTTVGYYRDTFTRTDDGWRMTSLKELVGWHEGNVFIVSNGQRKLIAKLSELYPDIDWERGVQQLMAGV
ncbi:nuclear transport factor 2 family protein [Glaciibacter sp. 2TAF33]|uniref:nuclear transport factor 2 family protein n=1 Tax=Glaciibacter sp. 2TAF33 TaxID=3233015 RepID=UPI003F8FACF3